MKELNKKQENRKAPSLIFERVLNTPLERIRYKAATGEFYEKIVLKNVAILTGKHLCWSLVLIKLQALKITSTTKLFFVIK